MYTALLTAQTGELSLLLQYSTVDYDPRGRQGGIMRVTTGHNDLSVTD